MKAAILFILPGFLSIMDPHGSKGYRPSSHLVFDGEESSYEQWEVKFLAYLSLRTLKRTVLGEGPPNVNKNEQAYSEIVQHLDNRSLSLVMREAADDGQKALAILREHYAGAGESRIMSLYATISTLQMKSSENLTDYIIRAEDAATALKTAGEEVKERCLMSMIANGLPQQYKPFVIAMNTTKEIDTYSKFKSALRSFEQNEKASSTRSGGRGGSTNDSRIMQANFQRMQLGDRSQSSSGNNRQHERYNNNRSKAITCYNCGGEGHKSATCPKKRNNQTDERSSGGRKWCNYCKNSSHYEKSCRKKPKNGKYGDQSKQAKDGDFEEEEAHNFDFQFACKVRSYGENDYSSADHSFDFGTDEVDDSTDGSDENNSNSGSSFGSDENAVVDVTSADNYEDNSSSFDFGPDDEVIDVTTAEDNSSSFDFGSDDEVIDVTADYEESSSSIHVGSEDEASVADNNQDVSTPCDFGSEKKVAVVESQSEENVEPATHSMDYSVVCKDGNVDSAKRVSDTVKKKALLVDTGATSHIVNKDNFIEVDDSYVPENHYIELADGTRTNSAAKKRGSVIFDITDEKGVSRTTTLHNTLYCPDYPENIFSVRAATKRGAEVHFTQDYDVLKSKSGVSFPIHRSDGLYYLYKVSTAIPEVQSGNLNTWHKILGHCNFADVLKLPKVVDGMRITDKNESHCGSCVKGKQTVNRSRKTDPRAEKPMDFVHTDVVGPITPPAKDGYKYGITFTDDFSSAIYVYFLREKSGAVDALRKFIADSSPIGKTKRLRSDNGGEFISEDFKDVLVKLGVKYEPTAPYCPHQNGTAERGFRTLFEMARCMLIESGLPKYLWSYAVMCAVFVRNRCYNQRTGETPYFLLTGRRPNLNKMHIFGSVCYSHVNEPKKKLDPRSKEGVFVGYDKDSSAFLVYYTENRTVRRHGMVTFTNNFRKDLPAAGTSNREDIPLNNEVADHDIDDDDSVNDEDSLNVFNSNNPDIPKRNPPRLRQQPHYLNDYAKSVNESHIDFCYKISPKTYREAVSSSDSEKWRQAMDEEMKSLKENNTFEVVELPHGKRTVGGRWVYAIKPSVEEDIYKARYVAKGFSQTYGVDYFSTFAPTTRLSTIRMVIQIAVQCNYLIHQMDVKSAYLNAPIDCEVYMDQPKGYEIISKDGKKYVCKLLKSLYGLKQSASNWREVIHKFFIEHGCVQSEADSCIFLLKTDDGKVFYVIWVDDIIVIADSEKMMMYGKSILKKRFKMKDLGTISRFLGILFTRHDDGSVSMDQTQYLQSILEKFGMESCNPRSTPCELKPPVSEDDTVVDEPQYRAIVGSLIYAMTCTRPDLSFVVSKLSQHLSRPTEADWNLLKQVLRYVKGTITYAVHFTKSDSALKLIGYSDSDWASCAEDRRSVTGYYFQLSEDGPAVSWKSRKQQTVALSTCEAEYMALCESSQESVYLNRVLKDLVQNGEDEPILLYGDNQGSLDLVQNSASKHNRTKHIDIRFHYIRELQQANVIKVKHVPTDENIADVMTKPLPKQKYTKFHKSLFGDS